MTDATWKQRVEQATRDEVVIKRILAAEAKGRTLNETIAKALPAKTVLVSKLVSFAAMMEMIGPDIAALDRAFRGGAA